MSTLKALFAWPTRNQWLYTFAVLVEFALIAALFGLATGLYSFLPIEDLPQLSRRSAIAFITPGLLEELVFRGPLVWFVVRQGRAPGWAIGLSLVLFVLWHPLNAAVYLTEARNLFFDWRFLSVAAGLGAGATWLALRSRSLWPPVIFHWLAVTGWMAFLGAPDFFE